jgi:hypothetical protein
MLAHQQLLGLVEAALLTAPPVASGNVYRSRTRPIPEGANQAVRVRLVRSTPTSLAGLQAPVDYATLIGVECLARATGAGVAADEAAGPVLVDVQAKLVADTTLAAAGYTLDLGPQLEWDSDDTDERVGAVIAVYTVQHRATAALAPA